METLRVMPGTVSMIFGTADHVSQNYWYFEHWLRFKSEIKYWTGLCMDGYSLVFLVLVQ